jgi:hypothetical protein
MEPTAPLEMEQTVPQVESDAGEVLMLRREPLEGGFKGDLQGTVQKSTQARPPSHAGRDHREAPGKGLSLHNIILIVEAITIRTLSSAGKCRRVARLMSRTAVLRLLRLRIDSRSIF